MKQWRYFHSKEEGVEGLDLFFVSMLDVARDLSGVPFHITSGFRTPEQNDTIGGVPDSAHLRGLAADISCINNRNRYHVLRGLIRAGFDRIGIYKAHIHVDYDLKTTFNKIIWLG